MNVLGHRIEVKGSATPFLSHTGYTRMSLLVKILILISALILIRALRRYLALRRIRRRLMDPQGWGSAGFTQMADERLEGLDASTFLPSENEELKALGRRFGRRWLRVAWEDRDRIPSSDSPRIKLIDRAMVGMGLITEKELEEAHRIGEVVDKALGDQRLDMEKAEGQAFKDLEDRLELKAQKKAEAERKRREAQLAVAHRRRTDIIYLGRGVSEDLNDRRANPEKLESMGLPVLATPQDIAGALEIPITRLRWLAFHSEASPVTHYARFMVPKKSGGQRTLFAPAPEMARSQRWIKENILDKVPVHDCAHGFTRGRSSVTNARPHTGKELVINIDIKDFFPSITYPRIKGLFRSLGYSPAVSTILALLCSECPRKKVIFEDLPYHVAIGPRALPQGACSSPALSNMVSWKMDGRLYGLCNKMGWTYTRYADDITFSKPRRGLEQAGYILAGARHILEDEGFELNQAKTRVLKRSAAQTVTGVVVNDKPGVGRKEIRRIRAILNNAAQKGIESQNRDNHPDFEGYLKGWIAYISMVNPEQGASLSARFQDIRRS